MRAGLNRKLTRAEIADAVRDLPPVLTADEAAMLARQAKSTLYHHVSRGRFRTSVRRGKPLLFWRDRFVMELFNS